MIAHSYIYILQYHHITSQDSMLALANWNRKYLPEISFLEIP